MTCCSVTIQETDPNYARFWQEPSKTIYTIFGFLLLKKISSANAITGILGKEKESTSAPD